MTLRFENAGTREDGEKIYRLVIDGATVREGLTIDEVVEAINRRDADPAAPLPMADEGAAGQPQPHRQRAAASKARPGDGIRGKAKENLGEEHGTRTLSGGDAASSPRGRAKKETEA